MKYFVRTNMYKAANVAFNPETIEAASYAWWSFVKKIKDQVIFNTYYYSPSTRKHQYKVRALLRELGIKIDREVQVKNGLQRIDSLKELNIAENVTFEMLAARAERKRIERNAKAKASRVAKKLEKFHVERDQISRFQLLQGGAA